MGVALQIVFSISICSSLTSHRLCTMYLSVYDSDASCHPRRPKGKNQGVNLRCTELVNVCSCVFSLTPFSTAHQLKGGKKN